jgi:C4-dicarboxylate-specific signal transduction histidine kinase
VLEDIFVIVALLTITVGLVLPGMLAHAAVEVMKAASKLATGTLADLSDAMEALAAGDLDKAHARVDIVPVVVHTRDELGQMAASFNILQEQVRRTANGLDGAREGLRDARRQLEESNATLESRVQERTAELQATSKKLVESAWHAGMAEIATGILHNVGNVLNSVLVAGSQAEAKVRRSRIGGLNKALELIRQNESSLCVFLSSDPKGRKLPAYLTKLAAAISAEQEEVLTELRTLNQNVEHIKTVINTQQSYARAPAFVEPADLREIVDDALEMNATAMQRDMVDLQREYGEVPIVPMERHKVMQIVANLVSNASWAVRKGSAELKIVKICIGRAQSGNIFVSVTDNGIGIAVEDLARIFEYGFSRREGGHGFGLHSAVLGAKSMGGSLCVCANGPNMGATFRLELPCLIPVAKAA